MIRNGLPWLALVSLAAACSSESARPASNSGNSACMPDPDAGRTCIGFGGIGGGGGGGGGGTVTPFDSGASLDATVDATASTALTGTLRVYQELPPVTARTANTAGWTIRTLAPLDPDAGTSLDAGTDAGVTLETVTTGLGEFTFAGAPTAAISPATGVSSYWLTANFPAMGNLGALFELPATANPAALLTVSDEALRTSLNAVTLVQADDRAAIAVWVRESRAAGALPVRNVVLTADGQASPSLYDGSSGLMELSETGTGALGFALLANVAVPATGDGWVTVNGPRLARPVPVRVRRQLVSWVVVTAN